MKKNSRIEYLLAQLRQNACSSEELAELYAYFMDDSGIKVIDKHLVKIWDSSSKYNADLDSENILSNIHGKICNQNDEQYLIKTSLNKNRNIMSFFKYAAIFIIAFGISWITHNITKIENPVAISALTDSNEVIVSYGSKSKIRLPDGSFVHLNSGSKIIYPALFDSTHRNVFLEGEAHFKVKADPARPFFVKTSDITIKVTGTEFNVNSYPESNIIETTLISGSLEISGKSYRLLEKKKSILIKPNQKAVFVKDIQKLDMDKKVELEKKTIETIIPKVSLQEIINTEPVTAWVNNRLIFENEKFKDLIVKIERWYDVKIILKTQSLSEERFTGSFENETIEQVLNALRMAEPFEYTINKNKIVIYRN